MAHELTQEICSALLVRGVQPLVEDAYTSESDDIVGFLGVDDYLAVSPDAVTWNERMPVGGNVQVGSWSMQEEGVSRFAAKVIHEFWQECGARITRKHRAVK